VRNAVRERHERQEPEAAMNTGHQSMSPRVSTGAFEAYEVGEFYDELLTPKGEPRPGLDLLVQKLHDMPAAELLRRQDMAERALFRMGITFNVYGDNQGVEKIFPFDVIPRPVAAAEYRHIEAGLRQRTKALNFFIQDVYHDREIVRAGVVPAFVIDSCSGFREQCRGLQPPRGVWCHINGCDLVRDDHGKIYVLEDNLRCPSGVSYVLQNRAVMKRIFPSLFDLSHIRPVDDYPGRLLSMLLSLAPQVDRPRVVVLTPGPFNSAYYEHSFLAQQMGVTLVEGRDLVVRDNQVVMRTTGGFERVDVIYRRVDDAFLDPLVFRQDSMLGVAGLMQAYRSGRVAIANAPGTGVADDKAVYAYVEAMIRFYLGEEPLLPNVPTYLCYRDDDRQHVLAHLDELVVKAVAEAGGYGMLMGPQSTADERAEFAEKIAANPRNYIAQPVLQLSRAPTLCNGRLVGRHVDLRPYILYGDDIFVLPGGLTRVALREGSLVVNSSQGGGSKDTWVLAGS
jgi:uncharacterized circularly permuted ATP-grasp superfamily protein